MEWVARSGIVLALLTLAACGGSGDGGGSAATGMVIPSSGSSGNYTPGVFPMSSTLASQCAIPRANTDDRAGSSFTENMFLRSWTNELYLWYGEVPDRHPAGFTTEQYFEELKTSALAPSGRDKDQFHFTYSTEEWEALSGSGIEVGYGAQWIILSDAPPRRIVVAFVEPGSPAAAASANLSRGVEVLVADGVDVVNGGSVDALNAAFFPESVGETHTFTIRELSGSTRSVTMTTVAVTHRPVLVTSTIDQSGVPVGYLLFNDHIATAESALIDAVNTLRTASIQDLILDLRYNGGGYLDIASELAYMIAGGSLTTGQPFERLVFNDKHPSTNPLTGRPLTPTPFHKTTQDFDVPAGRALPTLNLTRVYVITSGNTCSASESIINGLRGVGVQVYQIGSTTCGKPYGFYPQDNCGTTYFSIQFQGLNAQNFGDYPDGFGPQNVSGTPSVRLNGCSVGDDLSHQLGNVNEARLRAALAFRASNNQTCPVASGFAPGAELKATQAGLDADGVLYKSPARDNRILRD